MKPAFWSDVAIAKLAPATRLFYIGTWCLADDAGWFDGDVSEIGHALYGYEPRAARERRVSTMLTELVDAGRIRDHGCGHFDVPTMVSHQHLAGPSKQVQTVLNDHRRRCHPATPREDPPSPARIGVGNGDGNGQVMVSNGDGDGNAPVRARSARARGELGELKRKAGWDG